MLAPGEGSDYLQVVDARDVAGFIKRVCERQIYGTFNLAGHRLTWSDFIGLLRARDIAWVAGTVLAEAGVTESELPLYRANGGPRSGLMHIDNRRALAAGLELTETADTIHHVREWLRGRDDQPALSPRREAELIGRMQQRPPDAPAERSLG
jgi:2'-hydroxyisoflavone reductase